MCGHLLSVTPATEAKNSQWILSSRDWFTGVMISPSSPCSLKIASICAQVSDNFAHAIEPFIPAICHSKTQTTFAWPNLDFSYPPGIKTMANSNRLLENTYTFQSAPISRGLRNKRLLFKMEQTQVFWNTLVLKPGLLPYWFIQKIWHHYLRLCPSSFQVRGQRTSEIQSILSPQDNTRSFTWFLPLRIRQ